MTLLDATEYNDTRARRRKIIIASVVVIALIISGLVWAFRFWFEERIASNFFDALQNKNYETAYGVWLHDPQWKHHPEKYSQYPFNEFYRDWGPSGEWGLIKSFKVYGASGCPGGGSGIVVDVIVNDRVKHAQVWVEKKDRTMSTPPCELLFR